jgi:Uncharacterized protein conserved in bacteria
MIIGVGTVQLKADWCHSLKDKRMIVRSITAKVKNKFNVSISEIDDLDIHNSIILGIAAVTNETKHANSIIQNVINYIEESSDAEMIYSNIEII